MCSADISECRTWPRLDAGFGASRCVSALLPLFVAQKQEMKATLTCPGDTVPAFELQTSEQEVAYESALVVPHSHEGSALRKRVHGICRGFAILALFKFQPFGSFPQAFPVNPRLTFQNRHLKSVRNPPKNGDPSSLLAALRC